LLSPSSVDVLGEIFDRQKPVLAMDDRQVGAAKDSLRRRIHKYLACYIAKFLPVALKEVVSPPGIFVPPLVVNRPRILILLVAEGLARQETKTCGQETRKEQRVVDPATLRDELYRELTLAALEPTHLIAGCVAIKPPTSILPSTLSLSASRIELLVCTPDKAVSSPLLSTLPSCRAMVTFPALKVSESMRIHRHVDRQTKETSDYMLSFFTVVTDYVTCSFISLLCANQWTDRL
jgi:hypothetical protein